MKRIHKALLNVLLLLVLVFGVFGFGVYVGHSNLPEISKVMALANKETEVDTGADFNIFWKTWNTLRDKSIYSKDVSDQDMVWGAVEGLASSMGDPYTVFFPPEENKLFTNEIQGSFEGIGAEIGIKDKILTVITPLKDTPAFKSGIQKGDRILKIDDVSTSEMPIDKAISLIRGPKNSVVTLTILRDDEMATREFKITRGVIEMPVIDTKVVDDVFVIGFYTFSQNSAQAFRDALLKFTDSGLNKMVIDLRGNPGGYLDAAINIGSWFIDQGKVIVIQDFGDSRKQEVFRSSGPKIFNDNLKLVVLVDGGSASASEILAGALQEHGVATLVGEQTFGKGSVQELVNITDDTSLKVTVAKWLTPNGISISHNGLTPDVKVSINASDIEKGRDPQMDKAIEILNNKN